MGITKLLPPTAGAAPTWGVTASSSGLNLRPQRQRPFAARLELRADESRAGEAQTHDDSAARHVADQRARSVDAWAELHKKFGKLSLGDDLSRRDSLCRGRFSGHRADRLLLAFRPGALQGFARRLSPNLHARWQRPHAGQGRHLQESGARAHPAVDRRKGPRRLLQRRDRGQDRRLHAGERRLPAQSRFREAHFAPGSSRSRRIIAATTSSNCRRTARASPRCRC